MFLIPWLKTRASTSNAAAIESPAASSLDRLIRSPEESRSDVFESESVLSPSRRWASKDATFRLSDIEATSSLPRLPWAVPLAQSCGRIEYRQESAIT